MIFLTGAAQGIGLSTCIQLARAGHTVFGLVRPSSKLEAFKAAQAELGQHLRLLVGDVTDAGSLKRALSEMLEQVGCIDVLINNACHVVVGTCETCTIEEQMRSMDVNYFGPVRALQLVLPHMRKQRRGKVIQISSVAGYEPFPHLESYVASKFALEGLSESLAVHLAPWNISVSLVEPVGVKTEALREVVLGQRQLTDTGTYARYMELSKAQMIDAYESSLETEAVADVIEEVLRADKPHLRYPVGKYAIERASKRFRDARGDSYVTEKRQLLEGRGVYGLLGNEPV
jgi:NAD(P)-dependent dehydrogenase (short-subunit alcohol dehydrogenase family)